ncbi:DsrE family protein [Methylophaga sp. OBS4]|uniref:DsrE family protein n=1 Tax=Methylophaga sp. OBS4 TaxID=2991935 RepID=UPI00224CB4D6|nr:DsrE family protein [Methylophaga sp. OBS4]MCX4186879.1 DsrE family protein [Methylophaga sp. OBS4]
MNKQKILTFAFMDPPFESERTVTFFRLLDAALNQHAHIRVFAYEGAAALSFAKQSGHGNSVHGRNTEEENHPLTKNWITALQTKAKRNDLTFEWINCGLCVDERGVNDTIDGCGRGSPADLWKYASESLNTLTIGTK